MQILASPTTHVVWLGRVGDTLHYSVTRLSVQYGNRLIEYGKAESDADAKIKIDAALKQPPQLGPL